MITGVELMMLYLQKLNGFPIPEAFITKPVKTRKS